MRDSSISCKNGDIMSLLGKKLKINTQCVVEQNGVFLFSFLLVTYQRWNAEVVFSHTPEYVLPLEIGNAVVVFVSLDDKHLCIKLETPHSVRGRRAERCTQRFFVTGGERDAGLALGLRRCGTEAVGRHFICILHRRFPNPPFVFGWS